MTELATTQGQPIADSTGTTASGPDGNSSAPVGNAQTTSGPEIAEETFFDPASIAGKPELETAYKQMQRAWTQKNQAIKASQDKIDRYSQFEQDPMGTLKRVAAQYGVQIVPQDQSVPQDFNPQNWDEVKQHFFNEFKKEMNPVFNEVKALKKQNIENQLDQNYPDWRTYEDGMMSLLKEHPSLVNDPGKLYQLAVPPQVLEARATKAALAKLKATTETAQVSGTTSGKPLAAAPIISGPNAFLQAAAAAREKLASMGLRRPN